MENKLQSIMCEDDLKIYERKLKNFGTEKKDIFCNIKREENVSALNYLQVNKGKLVKVETAIGSCNRIKVGILLDIGEDYIIIKMSNSSVSTLIPAKNILFISVIHDNNKNMLNRC